MEDMTVEGITPNSITYASAINACGQSKQLARALDLLREARLAGIHVSKEKFILVLFYCILFFLTLYHYHIFIIRL